MFLLLAYSVFRKKEKSETAGKYNANIPSAIRDVLIASLQKGQLLGMAIAVVLIIAAFKMKGEDDYNLIKDTISLFGTLDGLGWALFMITVITSAILTKANKNDHRKDMEHYNNEIELKNSQIVALNKELENLRLKPHKK